MGGIGPIAETALARAIAFSEYLETHAVRAYSAGINDGVSAAKAVLKHIRAGDLKDGFSRRDVHQAKWANLSDLDDPIWFGFVGRALLAARQAGEDRRPA
jgi:hypothetical protein